jgi:hypothetical protein
MKYICLILILLQSPAYGQRNPGARSASMGTAGVALQDIWSLQQNPAGIASIRKATFAVGYEQHLLNQELSTQTALFVLPFGSNVVGISFEKYGFSQYKEQVSGFAYSRKFGESFNLSIGVKYHQLSITNYGSAQAFSVEAGFQYNVTGKLKVASHIANPSRSRYEQSSGSNLPVKLSFGAGYTFSDKLLVITDINKVLNFQTDVRLGVEYHIGKWLALRGGTSVNPFKQCAGFGMNYGHITVDAAIASHPVLGYSPQLGLNYEF